MAQKKKATTVKKDTQATTITRITATDDGATKKTAPTATKKRTTASKSTKKEISQPKTKKRTSFFTAIGNYFTGAWYELRQVRWPNRRTTWALTSAVLLFTVFFLVLIVLLDILFQWILERILG